MKKFVSKTMSLLLVAVMALSLAPAAARRMTAARRHRKAPAAHPGKALQPRSLPVIPVKKS